jgi:type I restriction enzyme S subunit
MVGEWTSINLGDVCTKIGSGATPRGGSEVYLATGPYALIRSQNVYNDGFRYDGLVYISEKHASELDSVDIKQQDVLLNITGDSVARACQVDPRVLPARVNQHVAIIRPDPERLDPRFLRYFLVSPAMQAKMLSWAGSGGTRNALTKGMIESFDVFAPEDIGEQRAIAHILGTLDDKIELNRKQNETLEAMARALFKAWFVDFEPVRAKTEGRWQRGQSLPGLRAHLYDLFPDRLVESELGEIPEGWEMISVDTEFDITMGQSPPGSTYNEIGEGLPFYQGRADFEFRFPKRRVFCTAPTRLAKIGDTLVSVRAPVGDINMALEDCAIGRGVAAVRHKTGSRSYTYHFMSSISDIFARFNAEGTVFGLIGKKDFHSISHVKPPRDLVLTYEKLAANLDDEVKKTNKNPAPSPNSATRYCPSSSPARCACRMPSTSSERRYDPGLVPRHSRGLRALARCADAAADLRGDGAQSRAKQRCVHRLRQDRGRGGVPRGGGKFPHAASPAQAHPGDALAVGLADCSHSRAQTRRCP